MSSPFFLDIKTNKFSIVIMCQDKVIGPIVKAEVYFKTLI